jgi:hypothetical protein
MAGVAQRDEILLNVFASMTAKYKMMNLQLSHAAAKLTTPGISFENLKAHLLGKHGINLRAAPHFLLGAQLRNGVYVLPA